MSFQNQIILKTTNDPKEKKVFLFGKYIGRFYNLRGGEFRTERKSLFDKYSGFGVPQAIFEDERLVFNRISIYYKREWYLAERNTFMKYGKIEQYPEGNKIYLNFKYFGKDDDNQLELQLDTKGN